MPYNVRSRCKGCDHRDIFAIGNWAIHRGVLLCPRCKSIANLKAIDSTCTQCGSVCDDDSLYDYSASVPYFKHYYFRDEPGPACLRCGAADVQLRLDSHFSVIPASLIDDGRGQQYLEKDIFLFNLALVCWELKVPVLPISEWYYLQRGELRYPDKPRPSTPILLDIRSELHAFRVVELPPPELWEPPSHQELCQTYRLLLIGWELEWREEGLPEPGGHRPQMNS